MKVDLDYLDVIENSLVKKCVIEYSLVFDDHLPHVALERGSYWSMYACCPVGIRSHDIAIRRRLPKSTRAESPWKSRQ